MNLTRELAQALAEDAETLAALHDRELTTETIAVLRGVGFPANLGLLPAGERSQGSANNCPGTASNRSPRANAARATSTVA